MALIIIGVTSVIWITNINIQNLYKHMVILITPMLVWIILQDKWFEEYNAKIIRNSFLIYATHFMIIYITRIVIRALVPETVNHYVAVIIWITSPIVNAILTYGFCYLIDMLLHKLRMEKLEALMTGNRL